MHNQMNDVLINKLYKFHCGFRKAYGTQHCLLVMIERNVGESEAVEEFLQQYLLIYQKLLIVFHMNC